MAVVTKYNAIVYTADAVADANHIFAENAIVVVGTAVYRGDGVNKLSALSPIGNATKFSDLTGSATVGQIPVIPATKVTSISAADLPVNTDVTDIAKTDTLIAALQKLQNRIAALELALTAAESALAAHALLAIGEVAGTTHPGASGE